MKTLLLLRHAKAEHQVEGQTDHERDLAERGVEEAPRIGHWLVEHQLVPASLLSSSAVRARRTAQIVAETCQFVGQVETFKELYLASPETYLRVIRAAAPSADRVMVVGHNPTLDELLYMLCGRHDGFPTAGLASVELNVETWDDVHLPRTYRLAHFIRGRSWNSLAVLLKKIHDHAPRHASAQHLGHELEQRGRADFLHERFE